MLIAPYIHRLVQILGTYMNHHRSWLLYCNWLLQGRYIMGSLGTLIILGHRNHHLHWLLSCSYSQEDLYIIGSLHNLIILLDLVLVLDLLIHSLHHRYKYRHHLWLFCHNYWQASQYIREPLPVHCLLG